MSFVKALWKSWTHYSWAVFTRDHNNINGIFWFRSYDHLFLMYFSLWRRMHISGVNPSLTGSQLTTSTPPFYTPPHSLKLPPATRYKIPWEAISTASLRVRDRLTESFWLNWQLMTSAWLSHLENADGKRFHPGVNAPLIGHACRREGGGGFI